jgi:hypothetical protein
MYEIRRLIVLCLTDPKWAIAHTQQIPEEVGLAHPLVRAVANYNRDLASRMPDDPIILGEIADEITEALKARVLT